jgi:hypothetical protein
LGGVTLVGCIGGGGGFEIVRMGLEDVVKVVTVVVAVVMVIIAVRSIWGSWEVSDVELSAEELLVVAAAMLFEQPLITGSVSRIKHKATPMVFILSGINAPLKRDSKCLLHIL